MNSCCLPPSVGPPGSRGPAGPTGPVGPQGPQGFQGGIAVSASGGVISTGSASFANGGGVSFGVSGQTVTASIAAPAGNIGALSAGTQSGSSGTFAFSNSNGLSFGMAGSQTITGSFSTLSFSNLNGVSFGTVGSTLTASVAAGATATGNVGALSAGTQSGSSGTFIMSNSGGISFGMAGSATVTGDVGAIRTVSAGNGSSMGDIKRLDFSNAGGVSFGLSTAAGSTGTITGSVAAGATATGNVGALSAGTQSGSSGTFVFSNSNGLSFGMAGSATVTGSFSTLSFANGNGVSFGTAGSTVTASIAQPPAIEYFDNMQFGGGNSVSNLVSFNVAGADRSLRVTPLTPVPFPSDMTIGTMMMDVSLSGSTASMVLGFTYTVSFGLYTSTGATLSLLNSASVSFGFTANASNADSLIGQRFLTVHSSLWSSPPVLTRGGEYFLGTLHSTSAVSMQSFTLVGQVLWSTGQRSGTIGGGSATATTVGFSPFYGVFSTSTGAMPASIANSDLGKTSLLGRAAVPHLVLVNNTAISAF